MLEALDMTPTALQTDLPTLVHLGKQIASVVDVLAIVVMLIGMVRFTLRFVVAEFEKVEVKRARLINADRIELGRYILTGLMVLIVADIIHTALSYTMADLLFLGLLVVIRALISHFLFQEVRHIREDPEI